MLINKVNFMNQSYQLPEVFSSQPGIPGADDSLGAISYLQLAENVRDIVAHGFYTQGQTFGNVAIRRATCNHL